MRTFPIRHVMASGLVLMAVGLILPWLAQDGADHLGYPVMATALALIGFGAGLATTVASVTLMAATPDEHVSGAAAIEETCYELGAALGVASSGPLPEPSTETACPPPCRPQHTTPWVREPMQPRNSAAPTAPRSWNRSPAPSPTA